jgi:hypothetical protein
MTQRLWSQEGQDVAEYARHIGGRRLARSGRVPTYFGKLNIILPIPGPR